VERRGDGTAREWTGGGGVFDPAAGAGVVGPRAGGGRWAHRSYVAQHLDVDRVHGVPAAAELGARSWCKACEASQILAFAFSKTKQRILNDDVLKRKIDHLVSEKPKPGNAMDDGSLSSVHPGGHGNTGH